MFNFLSEQQTYFNNLSGGIQIEYNYIRHENTMTVPLDYYTCIQFNYLIYQNEMVNNKWFFCFIDRFEFVNDKVTKLYLKTDVWQTWQFDVNYERSFIERRHEVTDSMNSLSDTPNEGTLINYKSLEHNFRGAYFVFCNADVTQEDTTNSSQYDFKLGNFSVPSMVLVYEAGQASSMAMDLQKIANKGYGDRISSAVFVPAFNDTFTILQNMIVDTVNGYPVCRGTEYSEDLLKETIEFDFSDVNLGHEKCLTFPYAKIVVQDMTTGQTIELEPNRFDSKIAKFEIQSTISETPSYRVIPLNYKEQNKAFAESLVIKCNTSLPVANNTYAKYLMNNQDMNNLKIAGAGVGIAGSIVAGSPMGAISGFESITNTLLQEKQAQKQPNQLSSITDGALERIQFQNGIRIMLMVMDEDHMKTANDYWTLFGYPQRCIDYPRPSVNTLDYEFIKLQNANIGGKMSQSDLIEIQDMFNRGVTMWKAEKFRQY